LYRTTINYLTNSQVRGACKSEAAVPGAIISAILFGTGLVLYLFVDRIDSEVRKG
jgi:hypothetical protein